MTPRTAPVSLTRLSCWNFSRKLPARVPAIGTVIIMSALSLNIAMAGKSAQQLGFADHIATRLSGGLPAPIPGYLIPQVGSPTVATALTGACGTLLAFVAAYMFARAVVPPSPRAQKG
jgi:hypothetical protein